MASPKPKPSSSPVAGKPEDAKTLVAAASAARKLQIQRLRTARLERDAITASLPVEVPVKKARQKKVAP